MRLQSPLFLILAMAVTGCGEQAEVDGDARGSTTPAYQRAESGPLLDDAQTPVRIGELGSGFAACNARGTTRDRVSSGPVPVRAAPFEQAQEIDGLPLGATFFICTRSHDQRWFGIVYDEGGEASPRCGVSQPVASRRIYEGPCAAGWVAASTIVLTSDSPQPRTVTPQDE